MPTLDYKALLDAAIAKAENHQKWLNARFKNIKTVSNTKVGQIGQAFVESVCTELNLPFKTPTDKNGNKINQSPWDIEILGKTFELKTATEDVNGYFQFNHIRYHRHYDAAIFIGVSPNQILFDCCSKADLATGEAGTLVTMEKDANASYKYTRRPTSLYPIVEFYARMTALITVIEVSKRPRRR